MRRAGGDDVNRARVAGGDGDALRVAHCLEMDVKDNGFRLEGATKPYEEYVLVAKRSATGDM